MPELVERFVLVRLVDDGENNSILVSLMPIPYRQVEPKQTLILLISLQRLAQDSCSCIPCYPLIK